jgi:hypothetical protein
MDSSGCFVHLVGLVQANTRNKPNNGLRVPANLVAFCLVFA